MTDACLLAVRAGLGLVLVTMDKAMLRLAGSEYGGHMLLLKET